MPLYKLYYEVRYDRALDAYEVYRHRTHSGSRQQVGTYATQESADVVAGILNVLRYFEHDAEEDMR